MRIHSQNKTLISDLYIEPMSILENKNNRRIYYYRDFEFSFSDVDYRNPEKLILAIGIDINKIGVTIEKDYITSYEHYLLKYLSLPINEFNKDFYNKNKSAREKPYVEAETVSRIIVRRNGIHYDSLKEKIYLNLYYIIPLINGVTINGKSAFKHIKELLILIENLINYLNKENFLYYIDCYKKQIEIRKYLKENNLLVFIGNNSILTNSTNPVPFKSPSSLEHTITFKDGTFIQGMIIKKGVTVITGGGYSGKTTLLDAIEMGVYNNDINSGLQWCIADNSAQKVNAEDGRHIGDINISSFYKHMPGCNDIKKFNTEDASGSVSQAVNIIEAVNNDVKVLLIDEDKSATNFMIRDNNMCKLLKNDPIIPFTNRIQCLYNDFDVSTILVIGGSSIYLKYADLVILMEDYIPYDITNQVKEMHFDEDTNNVEKPLFMQPRGIMHNKTKQDFLYFNIVKTNKNKEIILDEYTAAITHLTTIISNNQINYLANLLKIILTKSEFASGDIVQNIKINYKHLLSEIVFDITNTAKLECDLWFEDVREIDVVSTINRMRNLKKIIL